MHASLKTSMPELRVPCFQRNANIFCRRVFASLWSINFIMADVILRSVRIVCDLQISLRTGGGIGGASISYLVGIANFTGSITDANN